MATLHPDGFWYAPDEYLSQEQMDVNAVYIAQILYFVHGWKINAIAALLGNMQTESKINPALWENRTDYEAAGEDPNDNSHGFGLVQWTPWGKYTDYAERHGLERIHIKSQLQRIQAEVQNEIQWISTTKYNFSFYEFTQSAETPYYLAGAFVYNYERPNITEETYVERGEQAEYYYDLIKGIPSGGNPNLQNNAIINTAVSWAVGIANDDTHGYDQNDRWGPDYDCASLVIQAYENAGFSLRENGAGNTSNMRPVFMKLGFVQYTFIEGMTLQKGDVLWRDGHTAMYIGNEQIVSAHINELGTITGGQTGDQTGHEIDVSALTTNWEYVLRLPLYYVGTGNGRKLSKLLLYAAGSGII